MNSRTAPTSKSKGKQLLHATAIDQPAGSRAEVVALLNRQLANIADLQSQTKQAHWNVRGAEFYQLHKLFDDLAEPLGDHIDTIAERAVTLGGFALGTVRCAANTSDLPEFPLEPGAMEYARELAKRFALCANSARRAIAASDEKDDPDTADLLTDLSRDLEKAVYFLEAHFRN